MSSVLRQPLLLLPGIFCSLFLSAQGPVPPPPAKKVGVIADTKKMNVAADVKKTDSVMGAKKIGRGHRHDHDPLVRESFQRHLSPALSNAAPEAYDGGHGGSIHSRIAEDGIPFL